MPIQISEEQAKVIAKKNPELRSALPASVLNDTKVSPKKGETPAEKSQGDEWRQSHVSAITGMGLDDRTEKIITNALNSKYDKALWLAKKEKDTDFESALRTVKMESWNLAKAVKAGTLTKEEAERRLNAINSNFNRSTKLVTHYQDKVDGSYRSKKAYLGFNEDNFEIKEAVEVEKDWDRPIGFKKQMSNNVALKSDDGFWSWVGGVSEYFANPSLAAARSAIDKKTPNASGVKNENIREVVDEKAAYRRIKFHEDDTNDLIKNKLVPAISNWAKTGLANIDKKGEEAANTDELIGSALRYATKYGTLNMKKTDPELQQLKKMYDATKWSDGSRADWLKENRQKLTEVISDMGYYGSRHLYSTHKKNFNSPAYFENDKNAMKNFNNEMEALLRTKEVIDKSTQVFRKEAYDKMRKVEGGIYAFVSDRDKNDAASGFDGDVYKGVFENLLNSQNKIRSKTEIRQILEKSMGTKYTAFDKATGKWVEKFDTPDITREVDYAYNALVSGYKKQFNKLRGNEVDKLSLVSQGFGASASTVVGHGSIDLNDRSFNKTERALHAISLFKDQLDSENPGAVYFKTGEYNQAVTLDELDESRGSINPNNIKQTIDKFFDNKDLYDMEYRRYTSLPGKAAWTFVNKENGKAITMYMDKSVANQNGEYFTRNTYQSHADWAFSVNGKWDLKHLDNDGLKDLQIVTDQSGNYILKGTARDENGKLISFSRGDLGNIENTSIKDVEKMIKNRIQ